MSTTTTAPRSTRSNRSNRSARNTEVEAPVSEAPEAPEVHEGEVPEVPETTSGTAENPQEAWNYAAFATETKARLERAGIVTDYREVSTRNGNAIVLTLRPGKGQSDSMRAKVLFQVLTNAAKRFGKGFVSPSFGESVNVRLYTADGKEVEVYTKVGGKLSRDPFKGYYGASMKLWVNETQQVEAEEQAASEQQKQFIEMRNRALEAEAKARALEERLKALEAGGTSASVPTTRSNAEVEPGAFDATDVPF